MGGYNAGEVASGIAVKTIVNLVRESVEREDLRIPDKATGMSRPSIILRDAIHRGEQDHLSNCPGTTAVRGAWAPRWSAP